MMLHYKTNKDILKELDLLVYGHQEAKKALITLVNRSKLYHNQRWIRMISKEYLIQPSKCLLIGQSGTGKTHLITVLADILDFPLIKLDATKLNPTGASGGIKEEDIKRMIIKKAEELCEKKKGYYHSVEGTIDQTVVFIDEIDKLGRAFDSTGNWNDHVQSNFLTLFDNKSEFAGVSYIFAGAFNEITKAERNTSNSIGFINDLKTSKEHIDTRIVKCGLLPELVGRLTSIVELDQFTEKDYRHILVNILLPKKQMDMIYFNIAKIDLTDAKINTIVKIAMDSGQGIRALKRELDREFLEMEFNYEEVPQLEYYDYENDEFEDGIGL